MMSASTTRTETDSFGPIEVPADAYWGAQTQRSIENFPFGHREQMPVEIVHALGFVKQAAARVNAQIGGLDAELAEVIQQAAGEVARGDHDDQFPLVIWQTGSGTQSNMNANEVIAGRANEILTGKRGGKSPVHPNDHVNKGQSSNDSFPTAMHVAAARAVNDRLLPAMHVIHRRLSEQARDWDRIVKIGRTHLQDATPLTLGQEFSGYAWQIEAGIARVEGGAAARPRARPGRHRGRHRAQCAEGLRREVRGRDRQADPAAVRDRAQQVRGAGEPRQPGRAVRHAQRHRRVADQDRQRHPPARLRPALRPRRAPASRERAGQLDHAGQGQPDPVREPDHGRRPGDGQSCRGHRRRPPGPYGAERVQAADRRQRAALDRPARDRHGELHRALPRRHGAGRDSASPT